MRILIMGNSGSGKSTLARRLAKEHQLAALDLDTIVWEPGQVAVPRAPEAVAASLAAFVAANPGWVIEGCYGDLIEQVLPHCSQLLFLNPGVDACLANNRRRPWEPHKYASQEAQDAMFETLQDWVRTYDTREDAWSYAAHRRIFDGFGGDKAEVVDGQARDRRPDAAGQSASVAMSMTKR